jgi:hypothetical protein
VSNIVKYCESRIHISNGKKTVFDVTFQRMVRVSHTLTDLRPSSNKRNITTLPLSTKQRSERKWSENEVNKSREMMWKGPLQRQWHELNDNQHSTRLVLVLPSHPKKTINEYDTKGKFKHPSTVRVEKNSKVVSSCS